MLLCCSLDPVFRYTSYDLSLILHSIASTLAASRQAFEVVNILLTMIIKTSHYFWPAKNVIGVFYL